MPRQVTKKNPDLVEQMRTELNACKQHFKLLAQQSKGKLPYRWLIAFANGTIRDPSTRRLIALGKYIGFRISFQPGPHFLKFKPE